LLSIYILSLKWAEYFILRLMTSLLAYFSKKLSWQYSKIFSANAENLQFLVKIFLKIFHKIFLNFQNFCINFLTFSSFTWIGTFLRKIYIFSQNFYEYCKISKIFCKYNFWWNVIKSKKYLKIFFKNYWWERFQNSLVWKILREDVNFPNISEYFWKMFQFV